MPISTMPHCAPPSQPLDLWMAQRAIRSVSGILSLLTPSSLPPTSRSLSHLLWVPLFWLTIRTTRTSNLLRHQLPSPPLSSLYNKTFNSLLPQVFSNQDELLSLARLSAAEGYLSEEVIPFLGHSHQPITFKKVRWALRFPLPPPSKDPAARRFSSTPAFRQGPRSGEALDGAIRVAAPLTYANEDSVHLHFGSSCRLGSNPFVER